jgi:hypothetical protein
MSKMKFKKTDRVQSETYPTTIDFINDVIETILDEDNFERSASIISDYNTTNELLEFIQASNVEYFNFDVQIVDFRDEVEEYMITILDIGEVYVEPAADKNGRYHEIDGFLFVHKDIDSEVYNGRNRRNDVMIFDL